MKTLQRLWRCESGATAVEYGLIVALIAVASATIMGTLGTDIKDAFTTVHNKFAPPLP